MILKKKMKLWIMNMIWTDFWNDRKVACYAYDLNWFLKLSLSFLLCHVEPIAC